MNPFKINEVSVSIYEGMQTIVTCKHEASGIEVAIKKPRDKAALLDMRAEALNEIEWLVTNSPRYARILKSDKEFAKALEEENND